MIRASALASFNSIQEFADTEERIYNSHCSFATAAHRATIDHVDRGLTILTTLSSDLKKKLNKIAREEKIPENCQTRDWVIVQLEELEEIDDPDFSWFKKIWLLGRLCRDFQNGKCSYTNCKFSHDILRRGSIAGMRPPPKHHTNPLDTPCALPLLLVKRQPKELLL